MDVQSGTTPQRARRSWKVLAAGTAALVVLIVVALSGGLGWFSRDKGKLTAKDTVVLADFLNKTGEPVFDEALKQGLAVQLEQSPFLSILADTRVRQTLRLMNKPSETRITRDIARDICLRQGAKAFIVGSIAPLGSNYVIGLEALNSQTGDTIAREQAQATSREDVLKILSDLSRDLRSRLGESLSSIQKFNAPLQVTTSSLEALKAYAAGADTARKGNYGGAIPRLKAAIELDPSFALAYHALSSCYANTRQTQLARESAERAFALRDRVTERERLRITWGYYRQVTFEADRARETMEQLRDAYPRDSLAPTNAAALYLSIGQPQNAVRAAEEAMQLGSLGAATRANLSLGLLQLNRLPEAKAMAEKALQEGLDSLLLRSVLFDVAYITHDEQAMKRLLEETEKKYGAQRSLDIQAEVAAFEGKLKQSLALGERSSGISEGRGDAGPALLSRTRGLWISALFGNCAPARSFRPPADLADWGSEAIENVAPTFAMCGIAGADAIAADVASQYPKSTIIKGRTLPIIRGTLALQRGDAKAAVDALEPARPYDAAASFRTQYFRGLAYLRLKSGALAMAEFQSILDHRGQAALSPLYPLAHLGLARAAVLAGDAAKARKSYQEFLTMWKDADADLEPLRSARQEYERIQHP